MEAIARKYCFKASMKINTRANVQIGTFYAYGIKPTIAKHVERSAAKFILDYSSEALECSEVELVLHDECPVELSSVVYFEPMHASDES